MDEFIATLSPGTAIALILGGPILTAGATALLSRRRDNFKALTEAYTAVIERVTGLEGRVDSLEGKLSDERREHEHTRSLLTLAQMFIRTLMHWGAGDRQEPMPTPPAELQVGHE
ncbi:membrane protein [Mycobacterium Phage Nergal]|nr:membrane protein [Mycobacterium Phage Nergal]